MLVRIKDLSRGGAGIGHINSSSSNIVEGSRGKVVFVPFTTPGDLVKV